MSVQSEQAAEVFLHEPQFHLGFLPTEQPNPLTRDLEERFHESPAAGVRCLQRVDREVLAMCRRVFAGREYRRMSKTMLATVRNGHRVVFSGCGATGRLSILLEGMWRDAVERGKIAREYQDAVSSIMTGGDFAMIRSVEFFEDYASFGARQAQESGMVEGDMMVAITEGGETSSVLGSVQEALRCKCAVFLLFNNPAELLAAHVERSREAIEDPRVTVLDLSCGPMALAGSTRMQATTSEMLAAGAALEECACALSGREAPDWATEFGRLLDALEAPSCVQPLADYLALEASIYRRGGTVTYFADRFLLDIFTDAAERTPTFMLPPFRAGGDTVSPRPWAFVKNPLFTTEETWRRALNRPLRCLTWSSEELRAMGASEELAARPPAISADDMLKIRIGNEEVTERCESSEDTSVLLTLGTPSEELASAYETLARPFRKYVRADLRQWGLPAPTATPLELLDHLAVKLALNTISTGTMVLMGRVKGNWMSWVAASNKKLIDRSARLVSVLGGIDYAEAVKRIFAAREEIAALPPDQTPASPVQLVLSQLR
ncbi:MAG: hypothetical protein II943_05355 [Victivallales bacterium]|nr:hypothetical protein [Victivallales bacterium]